MALVEKTVKQRLFFFYENRQKYNKSNCLIQRLNMCRDLSHLSTSKRQPRS